MAKQRQSAARAGLATCAPQPNRQTKAQVMWPGLLQASSLATQPAPLEANSRAIRRVLLSASCRTKVKLLVQQPAKSQLLESPD
jgi:hypothetical protein